MKVLIACEFSGIVRDAFIARGHDAVSCDLLPTEKSGPHIQGDVLEVLDNGWDMMIAHPPCTYLSYAGTRSWNDKGRLWRRLDALRFFGQMWDAPIEKICIENPKGCASPTIAKYTQEIQPFYFGDREKKATWLWLKNLPKLAYFTENTLFEDKKTCVAPPEPSYIKPDGTPRFFTSGINKNRAHNRSRTFQGIANTMAEQWGE